MSKEILIVEDDAKLREELATFLKSHGFKTTYLENFHDLASQILKLNPNLILLDLNLPETDGETVCKEIRKNSTMGIIIITSKNNELDELISLNYGADHYITKPFNLHILLAKINALLRRSDPNLASDEIDAKDFVLNLGSSTIVKNDKTLELTKNEFKILRCLLKDRGKIISREDLMDYLWEGESFVDDNTLSVNVTRLRTKLEKLGLENLIETRRGQGYLLREPHEL